MQLDIKVTSETKNIWAVISSLNVLCFELRAMHDNNLNKSKHITYNDNAGLKLDAKYKLEVTDE